LKIDVKRADNAMLVELLRLLLGNTASSVIPCFLLAILLFLTLQNSTNQAALAVWMVAVIVVKLYSAHYSQRLLASGITEKEAPKRVLQLMVLNAVDAVAWGALAWVALGNTDMAGSIMVIAVLAAIAGGSMSSLAPVWSVFVVFCAFELATLVWKLVLLQDPTYSALAIAGAMYIAALLGQARNGSLSAKASIRLRFENLALIEQLKVESENARAAHKAAEAANLAKSKFLAAASHDLRQPIHAQGLFLEVLSKSPLSPRQREVLDKASDASQASAEMLNTLLDFSRIEAGAMEPYVRTFYLQPLLHKIERELAQQADAKALIYRSRETHLAVQSDPALLELILRNLVSNAIRYTQRGGILISCRKRGRQVLVEVWDTGVGIDAAQQEEIFLEFHQLGNPERDRQKGLGLGLAIAKGMADTLGHALTLRSVPNRGSSFKLRIPIAESAVFEEFNTASPIVNKPLELRILFVDDDEAVREGMQALLETWGCACQTADSMEEALELARATPPQLVISDFRLRGSQTGADAIAMLRGELGQDLPAFLITGDTAPQRLREALSSNIPLLHKPVPMAQLHAMLLSLKPQAEKRVPDHSVPLGTKLL
jgi:signal transduction histidine kinase/ActR/RegA family two-component response regulator